MSNGQLRRGWMRAIGATALTVALGLASVAGLSASAAASTPSSVSLVDWGYSGNGQNYRGYGQGYDGGSPTTSTVEANPATATESKGVVLIDTELSYAGAAGAGTGIVLTANGEVLTNYHVVEGATKITVTLASTGASYAATVVGHSTTSDVAVLQLQDAGGLQTASIDEDPVSTGDAVTAVGNAGGTGTLTAADGKVTDLSASITTASEGSVASETLHGLIETNADVVPGDSGGPLLDAEGEVVGIDTAASSGTQIDGYAIPITQALSVVQQIQDGKQSSTVRIGAAAFLGVQLTEQTGSAVAGVPVAGVVSGTAANALGLRTGDTVTAIDSISVSSAAQLSSAIAAHRPGEDVKVTWVDASGTEHTRTTTLTASPEA